MSVTGRFAVVTGASSGIGAAYAHRLAARGYDLILVARRKTRLDDLAERIRGDHGGTVQVHAADLADARDLADIERLLSERNDIDMLVNNAGVGELGPTAGAKADELEGVVQINVVALTRLSLAALSAFRRQKRGTIVNIGSIIALSATPGSAVYGGSKAYVLNFSQSLQLEYEKSPIKVQVVLPGPVRTEFFEASGAVSSTIFPDDLYMSAEELVDAALVALDAGELVCLPSLGIAGIWSAFEDARATLVKSTLATGRPAGRYRSI